MFAGQRIVAMAYGIAFVAGRVNPGSGAVIVGLTLKTGMNFYAMLNFFPLVFETVFDPHPVHVGLMGLAPAISTTFGAVFANAALSWFRGHNKEILLFGCIVMSMSDPQLVF